MADAEDIMKAKEVFGALCKYLDESDIDYQRVDEDMRVYFGMSDAERNHAISFTIDADLQVIRLDSLLPFVVPEKNTQKMAIEVCSINYDLMDGNFDYDEKNGRVIYRMTSTFQSSVIGNTVFSLMLITAISMVDKYANRLSAVCD